MPALITKAPLRACTDESALFKPDQSCKGETGVQSQSLCRCMLDIAVPSISFLSIDTLKSHADFPTQTIWLYVQKALLPRPDGWLVAPQAVWHSWPAFSALNAYGLCEDSTRIAGGNLRGGCASPSSRHGEGASLYTM